MFKNFKFFKDKPVLADVLDLIVLCIVTFIIAKLITSYIILNGYVPSGSMEKTIMTGDRIIANRLSYVNKDIQRGDIVVFYSPDDKAAGEKVHFVKRVIGLPGDEIKIQDNKLFINNQQVDEPYLTVDTNFNWPNNGLPYYKVPEDHYFMMGDNRNHSEDSRKWDNTFVPREDILGKVVLKYSLSPKNFHFKRIYGYNEYGI